MVDWGWVYKLLNDVTPYPWIAGGCAEPSAVQSGRRGRECICFLGKK